MAAYKETVKQERSEQRERFKAGLKKYSDKKHKGILQKLERAEQELESHHIYMKIETFELIWAVILNIISSSSPQNRTPDKLSLIIGLWTGSL